MLKSCSYCGRIHDERFICHQKEAAIKRRQKKKARDVEQFRGSVEWKRARSQVRERDIVCQVCLRGLHNPARQYETDNLSVHHIEPISDRWDERLDLDNMILLCARHHEMAEAGDITKAELQAIVADHESEME